ncbi:MAG: nicotinate (nicotinamide) nucleotide adenylyltransferase [Planctomycetales bacterium]|nr:nicotinate (nicotinamide) nucleotide adenylyltransferase [Planctomycetales bacterium]
MLGGAFDPPHAGHLWLAETARDRLGLDRVLLVPTGRPPHKGALEASVADRLEMARLAAAGRAGLEVSDIEARRPGPSFTVETLRELRAALPEGTGLVLLLGADAAADLPSWREPAEIRRLARVAVAPRAGGREPARGRRSPPVDDPLPEGGPDVSSREIRRRVRAGEPIAGLVPPEVERYIREKGLYT